MKKNIILIILAVTTSLFFSGCETSDYIANELGYSNSNDIQCGFKYGDGTETNDKYSCNSILSFINEKDKLKNEITSLKNEKDKLKNENNVQALINSAKICPEQTNIQCGIRYGDGTETNNFYDCKAILNLMKQSSNTTNNNYLNQKQIESLKIQDYANRLYIEKNSAPQE